MPAATPSVQRRALRQGSGSQDAPFRLWRLSGFATPRRAELLCRSPSRKLAAILSADVVGYSRLMGQNERPTVDTLKLYPAAIVQVGKRHHARGPERPP